MDSDIGDLKAEYEHLKGGVSTGTDAGKQKVLTDLEDKWNRADKKGEHYELRYQQALKTLTAVRAGLQSIYNRLGCSTGDAQGLGSQGVTEANMLSYLGVIEQRTNEILLLHSALQEGDEEEAELPIAREPMSQLQIKLPSTVEDYTDDEDEDEEDDTRPFTREELKLKTQRGLQRKQEKGMRKGHR